ncbi:helix-turn-helix domain-containing protein [Enterococcus termitis]
MKKYRKKLNLTEVELAESLGLSKHSVISYEKGATFQPVIR